MRTYTPEDVDRLFGWSIEARKCFTRDQQGQEIEVPNKRALVRVDTEFPLGIASDRYGVIQPRDIMGLFHAAAGNGTVEYINGGYFDHGRKIYLQVALRGANFEVRGQEHGAYFMLGAHNDGTGSFWIAFTPVRFVCTNMLKYLLKSVQSRLAIRHTKNASERLSLATALITRARSYFGEFHKDALRLVSQRFTVQDMKALTEELWPTPKSENLVHGVEATRHAVVQLFDGRQRGAEAIGGTRYAALNAVVEYLDHHQPRHGGRDGRLSAVLFGSQPATLKQLAYDRLAA
jgi:phage/plasmid-like protein (TIGR03299 family)